MPDTIQTKRCTKCKQIKPLSEFYKSRRNPDGLHSWCKSCVNAALKAYWQTQAGKEVNRRAGRKYGQTEKGRRAYRKRRLKYPDKIKARSALNTTIHAGQLAPPTDFQCQQCGAQAEQYHHWRGYAPEHWLDVIPLCRKCHRQYHPPCTPPIHPSVSPRSVSTSASTNSA